jgi:hypothetical protein
LFDQGFGCPPVWQPGAGGNLVERHGVVLAPRIPQQPTHGPEMGGIWLPKVLTDAHSFPLRS